MHALFLLLIDHVSKLKSGNTLLCCFGLVLTPSKSIFAKDKCKGKPQICFFFLETHDHDLPQY